MATVDRQQALDAALAQIDRAFGKGAPEPEPTPKEPGRPWWQVGWRVARFHRAMAARPERQQMRPPARNKSWASWFGQRVGERRWPDAPF